MRTKLKEFDKQRFRISATVSKFGSKKSYKGSLCTILLTDVTNLLTKIIIADHIWLTCGKWSENLKEGDIINFDARVGQYVKGYEGFRDDIYDKPLTLDYKFERPTKITVMKEE